MTLAVMGHQSYREVIEMDDRELATLDAVVQILNNPKGGKKGASPGSQRNRRGSARA